VIERSGLAGLMQSLECFEYIQHAAQAQIIGYASVHQMEKWFFNAVIERLQFLQAIQSTCGRPWRVGKLSKSPQPSWLLVATTAA
jgi:hypothetical protein